MIVRCIFPVGVFPPIQVEILHLSQWGFLHLKPQKPQQNARWRVSTTI
jgi:hypothetical protein